MKKRYQSLLVLLLCFNLYLAYEVYQLKQTPHVPSQQSESISKMVSEFETDVTRVVDDVNDKVVSVVQFQNERLSGSGTGVIYEIEDQYTYIVTNHHVIEDAQEIMVKLADASEVKATLLGSDAYSDLALLRIEANENLKSFKLGDSSLARVGEFVVAIGSPLGVEFSNTTTFGIISGKDRLVAVDLNGDGISDWDMLVLQTDAAINPGNSGGALVNMSGELIGINSLKISSDDVEGMGFSIPINEVIPIVQQLKDNGKVNYPMIGVSAIAVQELSPLSKTQMTISNDTEGVLILEVVKNSPAEKYGLQENDIIVSFDGVRVVDFKSFRKELYKKAPLDRVKIGVLRNHEIMEVEVVLD